jgi:hypothetical protein
MLKRHQDLFLREIPVLWAITKALFKQIDHPTARFVLFCTLVNHSRTYIRRYLSCL